MNISLCLSIHLLKNILVASVWGDYEQTLTYKFLFGHKFSNQLDKYLGAQLLDSMARVCLALKEIEKPHSKMAIQVCIPASHE